jgi:Protein of unknown function (DUF4238)
MAEKIFQHYIPRVYLKHFQIDDTRNKSFVHCIDFSNDYNTEIQRKGLNDKIFKIKKYYNDKRLEDPLAIENLFGEFFEPSYENIINEISEENPITPEIIDGLILWLYISKQRSPYLRENSKRMLGLITNTLNKYTNLELNEEGKKALEDNISKYSKQAHLNAFINSKDFMNLYRDILLKKHWKILKSIPEFPFWTNDNPGFSPNLHPLFSETNPFHRVMEMSSDSVIYFVLTPKYCLEIMPFNEGTPRNVNAQNMSIKFEYAPLELIYYINVGVFYTIYKLLISNSKQLLETCFEKKMKY